MPSEAVRLDAGWEAGAAEPDGEPTDWYPARVPGTAALALLHAGLWQPGEPSDLDAQDWWFRLRFAAAPAAYDEEVVLRLGGIATVAEVFLNGEPILESASMFVSHEVDVGSRLRAWNELAIRCRALAPLLRVERRPRARWRTRLVDGKLRFFRTSLLGRAPGFAPGPAPVGPWRPVVLERRRGIVVDELALRPRLEREEGVLAVRARVRAVAGEVGPVEVELAERRTAVAGGAAELTVPSVALWWPHTHGDPALHAFRMLAGDEVIAERRVGFRRLETSRALEDGLALRINDVPVFARGAVWTPVDFVGLAPTPSELRAALELAREGGMNMLRVPGLGAYESAEFHDLCDELGLLVWQDFMFANLDYPIDDPEFHALVEREARQVLAALAGRPSLAVLCGNSEVEQQVAMLGLDPALGRGELFGALLPRLADEADVDAVYLPSAPSGGELPFRPDRGVANYFGVGGYRRPIEDARRADVRFASECLAFANLPDDPPFEPAPRDFGADWDFADVRDHYLRLLYGVEPAELGGGRYEELARSATGEAMAEVFGEWRRRRSACAGGLILWFRDIVPGAGWGIVDHRGEPKVAWHHVRRVLAPVAVWTTDEGLGGVDVHVANDLPVPVAACLRVALYRDLELALDGAEERIDLSPRSYLQRNVESMLGRFVDAAYAYRFGPPAHDAIVVSLESTDRAELLSQAVRFPVGRPPHAEELGLEADARRCDDGLELAVRSRRLAWGVRVRVPGFVPSDNGFFVEPGRERIVRLRPRDQGAAFAGGEVVALNLAEPVRVRSAG